MTVELSDAELTALYDRYAPVLYARCLRILKNPEAAHDAVQDTFAKVLRRRGTFREESSPLTWMYAISTNHCLNQLRNTRSRSLKREERQEELGPEGLAPADEGLDDQRVLALLDQTDEQTQKVVLHTYFDDCTRQEVADLVGISVPTVRKRLNQFLDHARRTFGIAVAALFVAWSAS